MCDRSKAETDFLDEVEVLAPDAGRLEGERNVVDASDNVSVFANLASTDAATVPARILLAWTSNAAYVLRQVASFARDPPLFQSYLG